MRKTEILGKATKNWSLGLRRSLVKPGEDRKIRANNKYTDSRKVEPGWQRLGVAGRRSKVSLKLHFSARVRSFGSACHMCFYYLVYHVFFTYPPDLQLAYWNSIHNWNLHEKEYRNEYPTHAFKMF